MIKKQDELFTKSKAAILTGALQGVSAAEWGCRQRKYHRDKLALWESGINGEEFTRQCRALRLELGLMS